MCSPKPPKVQTIPERQALKLPDGGATGLRVDDEIRRRRALMASAYGGALGLGGAMTTTILGG
jgi:ABC-type enterobactin transport system permease subunit